MADDGQQYGVLVETDRGVYRLQSDQPLAVEDIVSHQQQQGRKVLGIAGDSLAPTPAAAPAAPSTPPAAQNPADATPAPTAGMPGVVHPTGFLGNLLESSPQITGAMQGARLAARYAPGLWKLPAAVAGAFAGGGGAEYLHGKAQELFGLPATREGTPADRGLRAGTISAATEGAAQVAAPVLQAGARAMTPAMSAAERVAPVLDAVPAGVKVVRGAGGKMASLGNTMSNPAAISDALDQISDGLKAGAPWANQTRDTLARSWWQQNAANGPDALAAAFKGLGSTAKELFGPYYGGVADLVAKMTPKTSGAADLGDLLEAAGSVYAGHPTGALLGAADAVGRRVLPRAAAAAVTDPQTTAAGALRWLRGGSYPEFGIPGRVVGTLFGGAVDPGNQPPARRAIRR